MSFSKQEDMCGEQSLDEIIDDIFLQGEPYPMVVNFNGEKGFNVEGLNHEAAKNIHGMWTPSTIDTSNLKIDEDEEPFIYRNHFRLFKHFNYFARDQNIGPFVISIKVETKDERKTYRVLLRLLGGTLHRIIPAETLPENPQPEHVAQLVESRLQVKGLHHVYMSKAPDFIQSYDEHPILKKHKFGIVYQKFGQRSESEMFNNTHTSKEFEDFLNLLGETVLLKDFAGFAGGLDVKNDLTGEKSVYTEYSDREIMFHVSTKLPYDPQDSQQVGRKRHIGNDIVSIVFQEENTPFVAGTFKSQLLKIIFVIQPITIEPNEIYYKISIVTELPCNTFNPILPHPAVYRHSIELREFLLTKLINAETAAMRAPLFDKLAKRTRGQLLNQLVNSLDICLEKNRPKSLSDAYLQNSSTLKKKFSLFFTKNKQKSNESSDDSFFTDKKETYALESNIQFENNRPVFNEKYRSSFYIKEKDERKRRLSIIRDTLPRIKNSNSASMPEINKNRSRVSTSIVPNSYSSKARDISRREGFSPSELKSKKMSCNLEYQSNASRALGIGNGIPKNNDFRGTFNGNLKNSISFSSADLPKRKNGTTNRLLNGLNENYNKQCIHGVSLSVPLDDKKISISKRSLLAEISNSFQSDLSNSYSFTSLDSRCSPAIVEENEKPIETTHKKAGEETELEAIIAEVNSLKQDKLDLSKELQMYKMENNEINLKSNALEKINLEQKLEIKRLRMDLQLYNYYDRQKTKSEFNLSIA